MDKLSEIIFEFEKLKDDEMTPEWKERVDWLIEEAKANSMYQLHAEVETEFQEMKLSEVDGFNSKEVYKQEPFFKALHQNKKSPLLGNTEQKLPDWFESVKDK